MSIRLRNLVLVAFATLTATQAQAIVLDWTNLSWAANSSNTNNSNSYDVDSAHAGNDVTISTFDNWTELGTPAVNQTLQGGAPQPQTSLVFTPDFSRDTHNFSVTISFSAYTQGVASVSFSLLNLDSNGNFYVDQVTNISATLTNGTQIAPTITNVGSNVLLSGTGLSQVLTGNGQVPDTGANSGNGNATISFTSWNIQSITFTFGNKNGIMNNPDPQTFGLSNITYSPVPEINPAFTVGTVCAVSAALCLRRRRRCVI